MLTQNNSITQQFHNGTVVWAKIVGYPWWPGVINTQKSEKIPNLYRIDFLGDHPSHGILPSHKIVKFEEFNCKKNNGRPSPQLRRAISEASQLFSALEQSKVQTGSTKSLVCLNIDKQNKTQSLTKPVKQQKNISPIINNEHKSNDIIEQQNMQQIITIPIKRGRKSKVAHKKHKLEQRQIDRHNKTLLRVKKQQVKNLIKLYRLEHIPKPRIEKKIIDIEPLICRKIYRILKLRGGYGAQQGMIIANQLKNKVKKVSDLVKIVNSIKLGQKLLQDENPPRNAQEHVEEQQRDKNIYTQDSSIVLAQHYS